MKKELMDRLQDLVYQTEIYFIHLNHSNPAIGEDQFVRKDMERRGFHIAEDGMEFNL